MSELERLGNTTTALTQLEGYFYQLELLESGKTQELLQNNTITPPNLSITINNEDPTQTYVDLQGRFAHLRQELLAVLTRLYDTTTSQPNVSTNTTNNTSISKLINQLQHDLSIDPDQSRSLLSGEHPLPLNMTELVSQHNDFIDPTIETYQALLYKKNHLHANINSERLVETINDLLQLLEITDTSDERLAQIEQFRLDNVDFDELCNRFLRQFQAQSKHPEHIRAYQFILFELFERRDGYETSRFINTIQNELEAVINEYNSREEKCVEKIATFREAMSTLYTFIDKQAAPKLGPNVLMLDDTDRYSALAKVIAGQNDSDDHNNNNNNETMLESADDSEQLNDATSKSIATTTTISTTTTTTASGNKNEEIPNTLQRKLIENYFKSLLDPTSSLSNLTPQQILIGLLDTMHINKEKAALELEKQATTTSIANKSNLDNIDDADSARPIKRQQTTATAIKTTSSSSNNYNDPNSTVVLESKTPTAPTKVDLDDNDDDDQDHCDDDDDDVESNVDDPQSDPNTMPLSNPTEQLYSMSLPLPPNLNLLPAPLYRLAMLFVSLQRLSWPNISIYVVNTRDYLLSPTSTIYSNEIFDPLARIQKDENNHISSIFINTTQLDMVSLAFAQYSILVTVPTMINTSPTFSPVANNSTQMETNDHTTTTTTTTTTQSNNNTTTNGRINNVSKPKRKKMEHIDDTSSLHFLFSFVSAFSTVTMFGYTAYSHLFPSSLSRQYLLPLQTRPQLLCVKNLTDNIGNDKDNTVTTTTDNDTAIKSSSSTKQSENNNNNLNNDDTPGLNLIELFQLNYGFEIPENNPIGDIILTHAYPWLQSLCGLNFSSVNSCQYTLTTDLISSLDHSDSTSEQQQQKNTKNGIKSTSIPLNQNKIRLTTLSVLQRLVTQSLAHFWLNHDLLSFHTQSTQYQTKSIANPLMKTFGWTLPGLNKDIITPTFPLITTTTSSTSPDLSKQPLNQQQQLHTVFVGGRNKSKPLNINQPTPPQVNPVLNSCSLILHAGLQPLPHTITTTTSYLDYVNASQAALSASNSAINKNKDQKSQIKLTLDQVLTHSTETFNQLLITLHTTGFYPLPTTPIIPVPTTASMDEDEQPQQGSSSPNTTQHPQHQNYYTNQSHFEFILKTTNNINNKDDDNFQHPTIHLFLSFQSYPFTITQHSIAPLSLAIFTTTPNSTLTSTHRLFSLEVVVSQSLYQLYGLPVSTLLPNNNTQKHSYARTTPIGTVMACSSHTLSPLQAILGLVVQQYNESSKGIEQINSPAGEENTANSNMMDE